MRVPIIAALVGALGCGVRTAAVTPPDLAGAASLVLAVRDGAHLELEAFSLVDTPRPALRTQVEALDAYEMYALVYEESLATLGLAPGPLVLVMDDPQQPLPTAAHEYAVIKDPEGLPASWQLSESRPAAISAAHVRGTPSPCAKFTQISLSREPAAMPNNTWAFAFPRTDGVVVAGTRQGELFEIDRDGNVATIPQNGFFLPSSGAVDPSGTLWVGDEFGELWRGEKDSKPETWQRVAQLSPLSNIDFMDVAPDGSEVVVLSRGGAIARWSEAAGWTYLGALESATGSTPAGGGILRLGADDVLAVSPSQRDVTRIRGGNTEVETLEAMSAFTSLVRIESLGIVLGSGLGELFVRRGERWMSLGPSGSAFWVLGPISYDGGFLWGSPYGNMGEYIADEFCPLFAPVNFTVRLLVPLGDGDLLALGESLAPPSPQGSILRRKK